MSREIVTTRVLNAEPEAVFRAFGDPGRLARWWGPKGFTNTFQEFDLKPGGRWRFLMHGPNGATYPNESVFAEVAEPQRIVLRHVSRPRYEMTITLAPQGEKTLLTWRMVFESASDCEKVRPLAAVANEENLDRLETELGRV